MTRDEAIAKLTELGPWVLQSEGQIEHAIHVASCTHMLVYREYGYHDLSAMEWFHANDNAPGHDPELRAQLLAACGLSGKEGV